jgi:hypothetical protein
VNRPGVALAYGRDLARNYGARLHVLNVVDDVLTRYSGEVGFAVPSIQEDLDKGRGGSSRRESRTRTAAS